MMTGIVVALSLQGCAAIRLPFFSPVERTRDQLKSGIAGFYDASSGVWEQVWGEHMHHGYYPGGARKDHVQAQVDMIDAVLEWSGVGRDGGAAPARVLDVGCGIGGSTRHIARKYGAEGVGITLSPVQAARAGALADAQGLGDKVQFQVADALNMPFADDSFDLVWACESGEHMPDKEKYVQEMARVLKPGGRIAIATWCQREEGDKPFTPKERATLDYLYGEWTHPYFISIDE